MDLLALEHIDGNRLKVVVQEEELPEREPLTLVFSKPDEQIEEPQLWRHVFDKNISRSVMLATGREDTRYADALGKLCLSDYDFQRALQVNRLLWSNGNSEEESGEKVFNEWLARWGVKSGEAKSSSGLTFDAFTDTPARKPTMQPEPGPAPAKRVYSNLEIALFLLAIVAVCGLLVYFLTA